MDTNRQQVLNSYFSPVAPGIIVGRANELVEPYERQPDLSGIKFEKGVVATPPIISFSENRPDLLVTGSGLASTLSSSFTQTNNQINSDNLINENLSDEFINEILPNFEQTYRYAESNSLITPQLNQIFERIKQYLSLSPLSKNLIDLIYGNILNFVKATPKTIHPLETYIFSFDQSIEDDPIVRAIGYRIGIYIGDSVDYSVYEIFVDKLVSYIKTVEKHGPFDVQYPSNRLQSFPTTAQIINMNRTEFEERMKQDGIEPNEGLYQDRLMVFSELFISYLKA